MKAQLTYGKAKIHHKYDGSEIIANAKMHSFGIALGYEHNLSKRTKLYVGTGYAHDNYDLQVQLKRPAASRSVDIRYSNFEAVAGLVHKF